jgi:uncharacterized protein
MKSAIITGASKGLGKAFAEELYEMGYHVLLIARSEELLKEVTSALTGNQSAHYLALDLIHSEAPEKIYSWCIDNDFKPDILINNAGFACWGYFKSLNLARQEEMLQVNINTLVSLTHRMLPLLQDQPKAYLMNVCSTSAYQAIPTLALYSASKAFGRTFSRALRHELKDTTVSVTCLSPGPIASNFLIEANMEAMAGTAQKFEMSPLAVAKAGLKAMFQGRAEAVPGFSNALGVFMSKLVPDFLLEKITENIYKSKLGKR